MDIIFQNPFRVLGLSVDATDREIVKQIDDLSIYTDMGKLIEYDSDNFFPVKPVRTPESIQEAKQRLDQPSSKLFYALFWFWENSNNTVDGMAFDELKNGNYERAIEFWERETGESINSQNKSNYKNLSIAQLGLSVKDKKLQKNYFFNGLSSSGEFLSNGYFEEFSKEILGMRHSVDLSKISNQYIDECITMAKPHIGKRKSEFRITKKELLDNFPDSLYDDIIQKLIGINIHNIENEIQISKQKRTDDVSTANKTGKELYKNTEDDIEQLLSVLSKTNLNYQLIADELSEEILQCSIDYFNEYYNSETDAGDDALKLINLAKKIAVGDKLKDRISDNIPNIKEYVDEKPERERLKPVQSDINFIYDRIKKIGSPGKMADAPIFATDLVNDCKPKLNSIKDFLGGTDVKFLKISDAVVGNALGLCLDLANKGMDAFKDKSASEQQTMARFIIENIEPVFRLTGTLEMSNSQRQSYFQFCTSLGISPTGPRVPIAPVSTSSSSSGGGCYIATMVYGSYEAPEVKVLRKFRDKVLSQSLLGLLFIKAYYKFSPTVVEQTKNIKFLHSLFRSILDYIIKLLVRSK